MRPKDQVLEVWGDFACFSRPEMKVERFSYPVITPSAARGIFDAIYCKRLEFRWQITRIEMLTYPSYIALRRNEVKEKVNLNAVFKWMEGKRPEPIFADATSDQAGTDQKGRTQRQTMALRGPRYRIHAEIRAWQGSEERQQGLEAQFRRRAANGKCVYQPCFGCREFPAYFELVDHDAPPVEPVPVDLHIGYMLYDVFDLSKPGRPDSKPSISLFRATVRNGTLAVPDYLSPEVLKGVREER